MSRLGEVLKSGVTNSAFALLDSLVDLIHDQLIEGGSFDDEFKQGLATVVLWEPQLRKGAASTDTKYDDMALTEIMQAAERILPVELVEAIRSIQVPFVDDEPE